MRQIAYPAALGSSALLARLPVADAAEWSLTPLYSAAVDYDSDRRLIQNGKDSESGFVTADLTFKRSTEDLQLTFEPRYTWRRYSDSSLGNGDERGASLGAAWTLERSTLNATASYLDQTTLVTELLETGFVSADTHRRQTLGGLNWNFNQTERLGVVSQVNYSDTSYYGLGAPVLSGYKFTSASLGERFVFSERGSFTLSADGDKLSSASPGNDSHEYGAQAEVAYAFSELLSADVALGRSRRELAGQSSDGTTVSAVVSRSLYDGLGRVSGTYTRSLVPYGFGFLIEQQKYDFVFARPLGVYVNAMLEFVRVQNNEATVLLRLDRPNYNNLALALSWRLRETWSLDWRLEGIRTQEIGFPDRTFSSWRTSMTLKWAPQPLLRQW